ncbi:coiled-coil domain-containing protein 86 [Cylas formicarius]|uniref:coiled-coil domain-containing protein 86 n=1 Tax=Cylas formicarius TaxID=197179 RepID=UPI00295883CC|nr:coiled-coil domain-containing protein 86 [Cylas formicarius]
MALVGKDSGNNATVPRGIPKSGRFWKSEKKKFSTIIKTRGIKSTLQKRKLLKEKRDKVKESSNAIKQAKQQEKELNKQRRRDNIHRREENRKKSEVFQVITNSKKLKKMKKKQLRYIEKRDTTVLKNN